MGRITSQGGQTHTMAEEISNNATIVDEMEPEEESLVLGDDDPRDAALHEHILSEECAWHGRIIDVNRLEVELPNGRRTSRDIVRHPGAAAVVALTDSGKIALVRQYRTALDRVTVEIPAGKLDPGEDPLECAKRELREETGFVAGRMRYLTTIASSAGFADELIRIYMATHLELDEACPDEDEFLNVDLVPLSELIDAVLARLRMPRPLWALLLAMRLRTVLPPTPMLQWNSRYAACAF